MCIMYPPSLPSLPPSLAHFLPFLHSSSHTHCAVILIWNYASFDHLANIGKPHRWSLSPSQSCWSKRSVLEAEEDLSAVGEARLLL